MFNFLINNIAETLSAQLASSVDANQINCVDSERSVHGGLDVAKKPKTWIHSIFEGILTNETRCLNCENVERLSNIDNQ